MYKYIYIYIVNIHIQIYIYVYIWASQQLPIKIGHFRPYFVLPASAVFLGPARGHSPARIRPISKLSEDSCFVLSWNKILVLEIASFFNKKYGVWKTKNRLLAILLTRPFFLNWILRCWSFHVHLMCRSPKFLLGNPPGASRSFSPPQWKTRYFLAPCLKEKSEGSKPFLGDDYYKPKMMTRNATNKNSYYYYYYYYGGLDWYFPNFEVLMEVHRGHSNLRHQEAEFPSKSLGSSGSGFSFT